MDFNPDEYLKEDTEDFNPDQYLNEKKEVSPLKSAVLGAGQGASLNFADEAIGALDALRSAGSGVVSGDYSKLSPQALLDAYRQSRDQYRGQFKEAQQTNPKSYLAGEFAGGAATLPLGVGEVTIPKIMAQSAALGAIQGLGASEADLTQGDISGALKDTTLGAGIGGALGAAFPLAGKALGNLPAKLEDVATNAAMRGFGMTKGLLNKLPKMEKAREAAKVMMGEGVLGSDTAEMIQKLQAVKESAGQKIGTYLQSKGTGFDPAESIAQIEKLRPAQTGGYYDQIHKALDNAIETIRANGDNPLSFQQANEIKGILQNAAKFNAYNPENLNLGARQDAATAFKNYLDDQLEKTAQQQRTIYEPDLTPDPNALNLGNTINMQPVTQTSVNPTEQQAFQDFLKNKEIYGATFPVEQGLANKASSEFNKRISLTDTIMAAGGLGAGALGSPQTAFQTMAVLGAKKLGEKYGNSAIAYGAKKAASMMTNLPEMLGTNPQVFGKYARILQNAAQKGTQALSTAHYVLMQQDPEYQEVIRNAEVTPGEQP